MKKQYVKPALVSEDYKLDSAITTTCELTVDPGDYYPRALPGMDPEDLEPGQEPRTMFVSFTGCDEEADEQHLPGDRLCLHIPYDGRHIFAS